MVKFSALLFLVLIITSFTGGVGSPAIAGPVFDSIPKSCFPARYWLGDAGDPCHCPPDLKCDNKKYRPTGNNCADRHGGARCPGGQEVVSCVVGTGHLPLPPELSHACCSLCPDGGELHVSWPNENGRTRNLSNRYNDIEWDQLFSGGFGDEPFGSVGENRRLTSATEEGQRYRSGELPEDFIDTGRVIMEQEFERELSQRSAASDGGRSSGGRGADPEKIMQSIMMSSSFDRDNGRWRDFTYECRRMQTITYDDNCPPQTGGELTGWDVDGDGVADFLTKEDALASGYSIDEVQPAHSGLVDPNNCQGPSGHMFHCGQCMRGTGCPTSTGASTGGGVIGNDSTGSSSGGVISNDGPGSPSGGVISND